MHKLPQIDKTILYTLPALLAISLLLLPEESLFFGFTMILIMFVFQVIIYPKKEIYGYSGLLNLSIPSIVITTFSIFIAIPSIYVCSTIDSPAIYPYFYSIVGFYLLFPAGLYFGNKIWFIDKSKVVKIYKSPLQQSKYDFIFADLLWLLIPIVLGLLFIYVARIDRIPLVELFLHPGDVARLSVIRDQSYLVANISVIEKYLVAWQRSVFIPVSIIVSLFLYVSYKQKKYLIIFVMFLFVGVIYNSLTLEKSPVAAIFLILMAFYYLKKQKLNFKVIIAAIIIIFAIPTIIMAIKFYREEGLFELLYISILNRIFLIPSKALYVHYEMFPQIHDFLWGRSTNLIAWMHPDGGFPLSNYVARFWWQDPHATGTLNAMFLAFFWADFGAIGVIVSSFLVGMATHWVYYVFLKISDYQKNIFYVVFSTCMLPAFTFSFFNSNYTILLITRGVIITMILLYCIKVFGKMVLSNNNKQTIK